jgi:hypothetical protein
MMENHRDKLNDAMDFISSNDGNDCIKTIAELANLSAGHYVDMVTHYRSYVALNYAEAPRLELIWDRLRNEYFPPDLLTMIEVDKGRDYVFKLFNENIGNYCLIDAFGEMESIGKRTARQYTV